MSAHLKKINHALMPACGVLLAMALDAIAAPPFNGAEEFLQRNCATCHSGNAPKAQLDLTKLAYDPGNPDNFAIWVKVHDRVSAGEMPPTGMPRPNAASAQQFVDGFVGALTAYERAAITDVPGSAPVAFAVGGKQYIAVTVGNGSAHAATWPGLVPEIQNPPNRGGSVWVFELP